MPETIAAMALVSAFTAGYNLIDSIWRRRELRRERERKDALMKVIGTVMAAVDMAPIEEKAQACLQAFWEALREWQAWNDARQAKRRRLP